MSEFNLVQDKVTTDNLLFVVDLSAIGATAELRYEGTDAITSTTRPNKLIVIPSAAGVTMPSVIYNLTIGTNNTFTASLVTQTLSYPSTLTGNFISPVANQAPTSMMINELTLQPLSPQLPTDTGGVTNEFVLVMDNNLTDSLLATFDLPNFNMQGELHYKAGAATTDSVPDTLILLDTSVPNATPITYQLVVSSATNSFTASSAYPGSLPASLSGSFVFVEGTDTPSTVIVNGLSASSGGTESTGSFFALQASAPGTYGVYDNETQIDSVTIATANTPLSWNPPEGYKPADGDHVFTLKPSASNSSATTSVSVMGSDFTSSFTMKVVSAANLPDIQTASTDSAYYVVHDTQAAILAAGTNSSPLATLLSRGHLLGAFSKDGTAPTTDVDTFVSLASGQQLLILDYDSRDTGTGGGTTTGGVSITLASTTRVVDEDANNIGTRIAPVLESGTNVTAAAATGADQINITGLTATNIPGGHLKVSVAATGTNGSTTGLNLIVATLSGVFKVNATTGVVDYYADAKYYGTEVKDAAGNTMHKPGEAAIAGATGVAVATIDSTLNGKNGTALQLNLKATATPEVVELLASHIGLQVVDSAGNYTQDWAAVAGNKTVTFELATNVPNEVVSAQRTVSVVSHDENGQPFMSFLKVIREMDEDANNTGRLVAFNTAGPNVYNAGNPNSNQIVIVDDNANFNGGSLTVSTLSGNMGQLRLGISSNSGVFKVDTSGNVTYYSDATYYGTEVKDANGNVINKTFDPKQAGTAANAVVIGKIDSLHQGKLGDYLSIQFNDKATPAIVQTLASSIYLGVTDSTGAMTQNWSAAAGEKLIEFKLKDSAGATAVTASRTVTIISHPEDDGSMFNAAATAAGTPGTGESLADVFVDSTATSLSGYIASVNNMRVFQDKDSDPMTFAVSASGETGSVTTGTLKLIDSDTTKAGPESFSVQLQSSTLLPLVYANATATTPSSFMLEDNMGNLVNVPLTLAGSTAPAGLYASFTAQVKNDENITVTITGKIWDKTGDGVLDLIEGTMGNEAFSMPLTMEDLNADGKPDQARVTEAPQVFSGRVTTDAAGLVTGFFVPNNTGGTTPTGPSAPPVLTVSTAARSFDEDLNNRGRRVAFNGEAGPNVTAPAATGSNQLKLVDNDSASFGGGYLKVSVAAAAGGSVTGLKLGVSGLSGVFSTSATGAVSYSPDATYYGTDVKDASGKLLHAAGDAAKAGTTWVLIGQVDSTLNGNNGSALKVSFNSAATPSIVEMFASHVGLVPLDPVTGKYTQNWEAVAGDKTVTYEVTDGATGTAVTASRVVSLVAQAETGVPTIGLLPVIRTIDEDFSNTGLLIAFNGEAGPNVVMPNNTNSNQVVIQDSDSANFNGGNLTVSVVSGNMNQLRLGISPISGVFKVNSTTREISYVSDAQYYGTNVKDSLGNIVNKSFTNAKVGTTSVVIGTLDATHQGKAGDYLSIQLNDKATVAITQLLAAHIYLGVTDTSGNLTQNWSAAAGEKIIEFKLKDSAAGTAVTATRTMEIISHPEDDFGGTEGDDTFQLDTAGFYDAGAGNDTVTGSAGNDGINGGLGNDLLSGGAGNDTLGGGAGDDTINGGDGTDFAQYFDSKSTDWTITAKNAGFELVNKTTGEKDVLSNIEVLQFNDTQKNLGINFWAAPDVQGMNSINGSEFADNINADTLATSNNAASKRDWINGGEGNDTINAGEGGDDITGGAGNDVIDGGSIGVQGLLNTLLSNPQANTWELENRAYYSGPANKYEITSAKVDGVMTYTIKDLRSNSPDGTDTVKNVDVLQFSDKQLRLTPNIWVDRGWDAEKGQPGTTPKGINLEGSGVADVLGDDTDVYAGSDRLVGNDGNDTLKGGAGADTFRGDKGNDAIDGGANRAESTTQTWDNNGSNGVDVAEYSGPASRYTITKSGSTFTVTDSKGAAGDGTDTLTNVEVLRFSDGEKNLMVVKTPQMNYTPGGSTGTITGYNWNGTDLADTINTQPSGTTGVRDWVNAGAGDDSIATGDGGDWIDAGEGDDTIDGGANGNTGNQWDDQDQVRYDASMSRFTITAGQDNQGKYLVVADKLPQEFGGYGTDKLYNIENLQFNDGSKDLSVHFNANGGQNNVQGTDFADTINSTALYEAYLDALPSGTLRLNAEGTQTVGFQVPNFTATQGTTYVAVVGTQSTFFNGTSQETTFYPAMQWDNTQQRQVPLSFDVTGQSSGGLSGSITLSNAGVGGTPVVMLYTKAGFAIDEMGRPSTQPVSPNSVSVAVLNTRDWVQSGAGNDVVFTGTGGDSIADGAGNDIYDGGDNGTSTTNTWDNIDRVNFNGAQSRYTIDVLTYSQLGSNSAIKAYIDEKYPSNKPASVVRITDKLPDGDGENYLLNVEQVQFKETSINLTYTVNPWQKPQGQDTNFWVGYNNYDGGVVDDAMDATTHDAASPTNEVSGYFSNRDAMNGGTGNDTLRSGAGGDMLTGGKGNDFLDGGGNGNSGNVWDDADQARFDNLANRYSVSFLREATDGEKNNTNVVKFNEKGIAVTTLVANTAYYVASPYYVAEGLIVVQDKVSDAKGGDGRDVLKNIEILGFTDTSEQLLANVNDMGTQVNTSGTRYGDKLVGSSTVVNWIDGRAGSDLLIAGDASNDTLMGGSGNDTLVGGLGSGDAAKMTAAYSQFTLERFTDDASGTVTGTGSTSTKPSYYYQVTHKIDEKLGGLGTDTLIGIEKVQFSDTTINLNVNEIFTNTPSVMNTINPDGSHGDQYFWIGSASYNTEKKFIGTVFGDVAKGRQDLNSPALEQFIMNGGNDTVYAGNGSDYVDAGDGNDYIELGDDPYTASTTPSVHKDIARLGPGNDTVVGGYSTAASEVNPLGTGFPGGTRFTVANAATATAEAKTTYYTDTQWDIVRYDDDASRYVVEIHDKMDASGAIGAKRATYVRGTSDFAAFDINADVYRGAFKDDAGATFTSAYITVNNKKMFDYNSFVVVVRDTLADALGGDGVDVMLGIDSISFEGSSLNINNSTSLVTYTVPTSVDVSTSLNALTGAPYTITTSGNNQTITTSAVAGIYYTLTSTSPGWIDGNRSGEVIQGLDTNDSIQGWAGNDTIHGNDGDDILVGGIGNDVLYGGADRTTDPNVSGANTFSYGDVAMYKNSLPIRFEIRKLVDTSGTVTGTANKVYFRVVDTASLIAIDKGSDGYLTVNALKAENQKAGIGFGIDTLIDIEHVQIGDTRLDIAPGTNSWKSNGLDRTYFGGTFFDDVLIGTDHGDELDGRGGNDTLDGGVESSSLVGNEWDIQDVVRYSGDRERFDVRGVTVQVGGSGTQKTYTVIPAGQAAAADTTLVDGIQVTDQLPGESGGSGTDILVNIERLEFNGVTFNIKPRYNYYDDMSVAPVNNVRPQAVNASGTDFADVLQGTAQSDWMSGGGSNDTLMGGAGGDDLEGGAGDDLILGGTNGVADQWGNTRTDTVRYSAPFERFTISTVLVDLDGNGSKETTAVQVQDSLPSDDPSSLGTDVLVGVEGISFSNRWVDMNIGRWEWTDDRGKTASNVSGSLFGDILSGDVRKDGTTPAEGQSDNLNGNGGNDVLLGVGGGDQLYGGAGNDVLDGGANGSSGDAWRDLDQARFSGKQSQYSVSNVTLQAVGTNGNYNVFIGNTNVANKTGGVFTVTDTTLSSDVAEVLTLAAGNMDLADGLHNGASLVVDNLSSDLGGEGADLVFNVESLMFQDGQLETEVRINANDWNSDGKLDWVNVTGTNKANTLTFADVVTKSGKTAEALQATQIDVDLREGDDVYTGGAGGESIRPGAGNDYVDGGANSGTNQWGGDMRDEVRFEGKFARYVLVDVSLNKANGAWTLSSTKGLSYTLGSGVAATATNAEVTKLGNEGLLGIGLAIDKMVANAGSQTSVSGWIVADRLPAAFQGTGVDALVNVEAIGFTDKWMPLSMQTFFQRDANNVITSAYVDGTTRDDVIGFTTSLGANDYQYTGDDNLRGNEGNDTIQGGAGADWLEGGAGDDVLDGGADGVDPMGNVRGDTVRYNGEFDRYTITANDDGSVTVADSQADGDGTDTLTHIEGLSFKDRWVQLGVNTWINRDPKSNKITNIFVQGSMLDEKIDVSTSANNTVSHSIRGNEGDDTLIGGAGPDDFMGGAGNDSIVGGANGTDAWGNPGFDVVRYEGAFARYTIEFSQDGENWSSTNPGTEGMMIRVVDSWADSDGGTGSDILSGIEAISFWDRFVMLQSTKTVQDLDGDGRPDSAELIGTNGADLLKGDVTNDRLKGESGNDTLMGGAGGDWLQGGTGDDSLDGGANGTDASGRVLIDVAAYKNAASTYTISANTDGSYTVVSASTDADSEGTDTLLHVEGLQFSDRFVSLVVDRQERDLNKDGVTDLVEVRGLDLTSTGDTLTFASGKGAIAHNFMGGLGNDTLTGGSGADGFDGGAGNDSLVGGDGVDRARFSGKYAEYTLNTNTTTGVTTVTHNNQGADGIDTLSGIEELVFSDRIYKLGTQTITTKDVDTDGNQKIDTRIMSGTDSDDTLVGSSTLANVIDAGTGNDNITGGAMGDDITPGAGNDRVNGGANNGLDAAGNPNMDRVFYTGKQATYTLSAWEKASFTLSGNIETGDILSVTVGSKTVNYVATSNVLAAQATAFAAAIQTAVDTSSTEFTATASGTTLSLIGKDMLFAVIPTVSNGTHAVSGTYTVNGADQSGKTLVVNSETGLTTGMFVSYAVTTTGSSTTTYGPYKIEAISGTSLTLADSLGASPANATTLSITETNADTTTATTVATYERWYEVSGSDTGTDQLVNIEQVVFSDAAVDLSFKTSKTAAWGASGQVEVSTLFTGTALSDLMMSSAANEVFVGMGGADHFVIPDGAGVDTIKDFSTGASGDVLTLLLGMGDTDGLNGSGVDTVAKALAKGSQQGADTVFDFGAGNTVRLVGVALSDLSADNFEVMPSF
mgnify:CR=1 FL=1